MQLIADGLLEDHDEQQASLDIVLAEADRLLEARATVCRMSGC